MLKTTDSLDTIGFFVSHARDLGVMLDTLRVHGTDYPIVDRKFCDSDGRLAPHKGPWRVAVIKGPAWRHAETYAQEALFGFAKKFEACPRIELVEPELPDGLNRVHDLHSTIYNASLAYYFKDESEQQHLVSPIMNELIERGRRIGLDEYRAALTEQEELIHQMDQRFEDFDCMVTLSTASVAPLREDVELPDSALVWTFLHLPAVSAPVFTSAEGLPFGLQIIGSRYGDVNLLALIDHLAEQGLLPERSNEPRQLVHAAGAA
jgi:Asp-tRNA(Asn)/Glu-tRNA(Gln) amidotransferase A subunit family amidase